MQDELKEMCPGFRDPQISSISSILKRLEPKLVEYVLSAKNEKWRALYLSNIWRLDTHLRQRRISGLWVAVHIQCNFLIELEQKSWESAVTGFTSPELEGVLQFLAPFHVNRQQEILRHFRERSKSFLQFLSWIDETSCGSAVEKEIQRMALDHIQPWLSMQLNITQEQRNCILACYSRLHASHIPLLTELLVLCMSQMKSDMMEKICLFSPGGLFTIFENCDVSLLYQVVDTICSMPTEDAACDIIQTRGHLSEVLYLELLRTCRAESFNGSLLIEFLVQISNFREILPYIDLLTALSLEMRPSLVLLSQRLEPADQEALLRIFRLRKVSDCSIVIERFHSIDDSTLNVLIRATEDFQDDEIARIVLFFSVFDSEVIHQIIVAVLGLDRNRRHDVYTVMKGTDKKTPLAFLQMLTYIKDEYRLARYIEMIKRMSDAVRISLLAQVLSRDALDVTYMILEFLFNGVLPREDLVFILSNATNVVRGRFMQHLKERPINEQSGLFRFLRTIEPCKQCAIIERYVNYNEQAAEALLELSDTISSSYFDALAQLMIDTTQSDSIRILLACRGMNEMACVQVISFLKLILVKEIVLFLDCIWEAINPNQSFGQRIRKIIQCSLTVGKGGILVFLGALSVLSMETRSLFVDQVMSLPEAQQYLQIVSVLPTSEKNCLVAVLGKLGPESKTLIQSLNSMTTDDQCHLIQLLSNVDEATLMKVPEILSEFETDAIVRITKALTEKIRHANHLQLLQLLLSSQQEIILDLVNLLNDCPESQPAKDFCQLLIRFSKPLREQFLDTMMSSLKGVALETIKDICMGLNSNEAVQALLSMTNRLKRDKHCFQLIHVLHSYKHKRKLLRILRILEVEDAISSIRQILLFDRARRKQFSEFLRNWKPEYVCLACIINQLMMIGIRNSKRVINVYFLAP